MAKTITFLLKNNLILRKIDSANRRRFLLYITLDGEDEVESLRTPIGDVEALLLKGLDADQRKVLVSALRICRDNLGATP